MAQEPTIFIVHIGKATHRLVLPPLPADGLPEFAVEVLGKDAAGQARWDKPGPNGYGPAIICAVMHYTMRYPVRAGSTIEIGRVSSKVAYDQPGNSRDVPFLVLNEPAPPNMADA